MIHLYDYLASGNGYKVRLLLHQLNLAYELIELDILDGETRTPEYLDLNPNGRIPLVQLPDGTCLAESNAILFFFAEGTPFLPEDRFDKAKVLQWMFFEQYSHEPNIATSRFILHYTDIDDERRAALKQKKPLGYAALDVMEHHLKDRRFMVADRYTIADIALYAYTHVADEGGFDLGRYTAINKWLERVRCEPDHVPITWRPSSAAA